MNEHVISCVHGALRWCHAGCSLIMPSGPMIGSRSTMTLNRIKQSVQIEFGWSSMQNFWACSLTCVCMCYSGFLPLTHGIHSRVYSLICCPWKEFGSLTRTTENERKCTNYLINHSNHLFCIQIDTLWPPVWIGQDCPFKGPWLPSFSVISLPVSPPLLWHFHTVATVPCPSFRSSLFPISSPSLMQR